MQTDVPTVAYWMGEPISALSRDELEALFIDAHKQVELLRAENHRRSVEHIRDIAQMARERSQAKRPLLLRVLMGD